MGEQIVPSLCVPVNERPEQLLPHERAFHNFVAHTSVPLLYSPDRSAREGESTQEDIDPCILV